MRSPESLQSIIQNFNEVEKGCPIEKQSKNLIDVCTVMMHPVFRHALQELTSRRLLKLHRAI